MTATVVPLTLPSIPWAYSGPGCGTVRVLAEKYEARLDEAQPGCPRSQPDADHAGQKVAGVRDSQPSLPPGHPEAATGACSALPSEGEGMLVPLCVQLYGKGWTPPAISSPGARQSSQKHHFCGNHMTQCCGPVGCAPGAVAPLEAVPLLCTPRG